MPLAEWWLKPWNNQQDFVKVQIDPGCMKDSAGKFGLDIMPPRAIANVQKETENAWAGARVPAGSVAASDGCEPS